MSERTVIVTGASGALGRCLVARLAGRARVWACVRAAARTIPGAERVIAADLADPAATIPLAPGATVFHLAAFVHRRPQSDAERDELRQVNEHASARLARACREAGATLVFASTVAVFGDRAGRVPDGAEPRPQTDYGRAKLAAEDALRAEGERGLRHAIVRFPLLYGPRGRGNMERMLRAIQARRYLPIGDPQTAKSCLYLDDAAAALELAAAVAAERGRTFTAAPRRTPTLGELHAAAFAAAGRTAPPHLPAGLARLLARGADLGLRLAGRKPFLASAVDTLTSPTDFDGAAFHAATGFVDEVSLEDGLRRTAEWLRAKASAAEA